MTITKDQAQMLTTLARACRPNGASRWDTGGTLAAISQVKDRSLAEVIMATIRAAADRDADTPGVIPKPGPHWQEAKAVAPPKPLNTMDPASRCTVCSQPEDHRLHPADHPFSHVKDIPKWDTAAIAADLRTQLQPMAPPEPRKSLDDLARDPAVARVRAQMATAQAELATPAPQAAAEAGGTGAMTEGARDA